VPRKAAKSNRSDGETYGRTETCRHEDHDKIDIFQGSRRGQGEAIERAGGCDYEERKGGCEGDDITGNRGFEDHVAVRDYISDSDGTINRSGSDRKRSGRVSNIVHKRRAATTAAEIAYDVAAATLKANLNSF